MIRKPAKDEDHPADEHYMDQLNEIQKKGKSWLVKHLKKEDPTAGAVYTSKLTQAAYPIPGTSPEEKAAARKILNEYGPVKYDKRGYPDKATPKQVGALAERLERDRQMTGSDGRYDKPKKKVNAYAEVKFPIPKINFSLLRDPKREEREAALEKMRVSAFTRSSTDKDQGIGSLANATGRKLRATAAKDSWTKNRETIYEK
jgi:hypothetical protein